MAFQWEYVDPYPEYYAQLVKQYGSPSEKKSTMTHEEIKKKAEKLNWLHSIELFPGYTTPGALDHCKEALATNRFGVPEDLTGKSVLDIGCADGYFSFLAEKRGAKFVRAIDYYQKPTFSNEGIRLAMDCLGSQVEFTNCSLKHYPGYRMEVLFYFGVLYHTQNPIKELQLVSDLTIEYVLIETAIAQNDHGVKPVWEFRPGFDNDPTNYWYPSIKGLEVALIHVGFKKVLLIWTDGIRATFKADK